MTTSAINRVLGLFLDAFRDLSVSVPMEDVERLAIVVHHSMQQGRRAYHTSSHVFDIADGMNARQTLAALFHDIVYYQIDGGFPEKARGVLDSAVRVENDHIVLRGWERGDSGAMLCSALFGFDAGDTLPINGGLNEFLSAVVATRLLQPYLSLPDLIAIATCIEATIPFRGPDANGRLVFERAADRVRRAAEILRVELTPTEVDRIVTDAVVIANRDVSNFSTAEPGHFLATMWLLIEESNAPLDVVGAYTIQEYRRALMGMERFAASLDPDLVFHGYRGTPSDVELRDLQAAARRNLAFATNYLSGKIVSIALIEALALETGGDCPVAMILGDISDGVDIPAWVTGTPASGGRSQDADSAVLSMFENGRPGTTTYDLTTSPLAAQIYRVEGHAGTMSALGHAKRMFEGEETPHEFLVTLRPELVRWVAGACARMAPSRAEKLRAIEAEF